MKAETVEQLDAALEEAAAKLDANHLDGEEKGE